MFQHMHWKRFLSVAAREYVRSQWDQMAGIQRFLRRPSAGSEGEGSGGGRSEGSRRSVSSKGAHSSMSSLAILETGDAGGGWTVFPDRHRGNGAGKEEIRPGDHARGGSTGRGNKTARFRIDGSGEGEAVLSEGRGELGPTEGEYTGVG